MSVENHRTRVRCDNPKLYRWKSLEANTPFAPFFDLPIYVDKYDRKLANDLVKLISEKSIGDFRKGQEIWLTYNLFDRKEKVVKDFADRIYQTYVEYNKELGYSCLSKDKLWIRGWGTILHAGDYLLEHCHSSNENTYLSGFISLSTLGTTTDFNIPYISFDAGYWKLKNIIGETILFPSWAMHKVDANPTMDKRYSVSFDIFTEESMNHAKINRTKGRNTTGNSVLLSKRISEV